MRTFRCTSRPSLSNFRPLHSRRSPLCFPVAFSLLRVHSFLYCYLFFPHYFPIASHSHRLYLYPHCIRPPSKFLAPCFPPPFIMIQPHCTYVKLHARAGKYSQSPQRNSKYFIHIHRTNELPFFLDMKSSLQTRLKESTVLRDDFVFMEKQWMRSGPEDRGEVVGKVSLYIIKIACSVRNA